MENATKALLIAAGVLMGILILSLGVFLYRSLSGYVETVQEDMEENALIKFNNQFLKYVNVPLDSNGNPLKDTNGNIKTDFDITIQDVVTVANIAYENNKDDILSGSINANTDYTERNSYVTVNIKYNGNIKIDHIENNINSTDISNPNKPSASYLLTNDKGYKYKCYKIKISPETGRIYEINFE
ncbi:MAG: hypothetical protein HFJ55_03995 [Clostridia bacterium]|jgi:hypothetical protein|nr:hypothetical protein [Clostridia bacterium]